VFSPYRFSVGPQLRQTSQFPWTPPPAAPRKIFHATLKIPAAAGDLTLYYPKWIPGEHAPDGPVVDLAGLKFSAGGLALKWRRDLLDGFTIT